MQYIYIVYAFDILKVLQILRISFHKEAGFKCILLAFRPLRNNYFGTQQVKYMDYNAC